jgi:hypothetical protein
MSRPLLFAAAVLITMAAEQRHEGRQCAAMGANYAACMDAMELPR